MSQAWLIDESTILSSLFYFSSCIEVQLCAIDVRVSLGPKRPTGGSIRESGPSVCLNRSRNTFPFPRVEEIPVHAIGYSRVESRKIESVAEENNQRRVGYLVFRIRKASGVRLHSVNGDHGSRPGRPLSDDYLPFLLLSPLAGAATDTP